VQDRRREERLGGPSGYHEAFRDDDHVLRTLTKLLDAASARRKLDPADGLEDAELDDDARVHVIHGDVARAERVLVNVRRFTGVLTITDSAILAAPSQVDQELLTASPLAFMESHGSLVVPWDTLVQVAQALATTSPDTLLDYIRQEEAQFRTESVHSHYTSGRRYSDYISPEICEEIAPSIVRPTTSSGGPRVTQSLRPSRSSVQDNELSGTPGAPPPRPTTGV
jgi:hypothetical protein